MACDITPSQHRHEDENNGSNSEALQLPAQLGAGYWRLAPSFLSLLFSLSRARRSFRLVFHTRNPIGSAEMEALLREFNLLCDGKHPAFDGQNRTKQVMRVIQEHHRITM